MIKDKVESVFRSISDDELRICVEEIKMADEYGQKNYDQISGISRQLSEIGGVEYNRAVCMVERFVLRQAAFKWCLE